MATPIEYYSKVPRPRRTAQVQHGMHGILLWYRHPFCHSAIWELLEHSKDDNTVREVLPPLVVPSYTQEDSH